MTQQETDPEFEEIIDYVEDYMDFASSYYENKYLKRRIKSRMRRRKKDDYDEYLSLLKEEDEERQALLDALSVNVTSFFRNPDVWEEIRGLMRELSSETSGKLKFWSAASSDGREAYSMAMLALDDPKVDASRIEITATDIDREILSVARRGIYLKTQTSDIEDQLDFLGGYSDYIDRDEERYEVKDKVKNMISFERHDLIKGRPKSGYDLVLNRNLLIYIDKKFKIPILETLRDSLEEGRYLVIGKTESLPLEIKKDFEAVNNRLRIYQKK